MSCNSCAKRFSFLRPEKGCPGCGFSYCSKCLNNKVFLQKINAEAKVCMKCNRSTDNKTNENKIIPPDAYHKRLAAIGDKIFTNPSATSSTSAEGKSPDDEILVRLKKLKEDKDANKVATVEEIDQRLKNLKDKVPSTTDAELQSRLARLRGVPEVVTNKPDLPIKDFRTEQDQADDLLKQYIKQTQIDTKYKDEFDSLVTDMESRMQKLKETNPPPGSEGRTTASNIPEKEESEDEEESVRKIVEKIRTEATLEEEEIAPSTRDELPFCEICNEDATMRCLGCRYLFCKQCFLDHKDDDDGCDCYETFMLPKDHH